MLQLELHYFFQVPVPCHSSVFLAWFISEQNSAFPRVAYKNGNAHSRSLYIKKKKP